jgi:hypothetical protein
LILTDFYRKNTKDKKKPPSIRNISTEIKPDSIIRKKGSVIIGFKFYILIIPAFMKNE